MDVQKREGREQKFFWEKERKRKDLTKPRKKHKFIFCQLIAGTVKRLLVQPHFICSIPTNFHSTFSLIQDRYVLLHHTSISLQCTQVAICLIIWSTYWSVVQGTRHLTDTRCTTITMGLAYSIVWTYDTVARICCHEKISLGSSKSSKIYSTIKNSKVKVPGLGGGKTSIHSLWHPLKQHFSVVPLHVESIVHASPILSQIPSRPLLGAGHELFKPGTAPGMAEIRIRLVLN